MSNTTLELSDTYIGMPGTMQGGYIAGLAAGDSDGPIRVRIRRPLHPGESVVRTVEDGKTVVHRGDELVMAASNSPLHVAAQAPIARDKIDAAMGRPMGWDPPYPNCIGCGHEVDGLGVRIHPQETASMLLLSGHPLLSGPTKMVLFRENSFGLLLTA